MLLFQNTLAARMILWSRGSTRHGPHIRAQLPLPPLTPHLAQSCTEQIIQTTSSQLHCWSTKQQASTLLHDIQCSCPRDLERPASGDIKLAALIYELPLISIIAFFNIPPSNDNLTW